MHTRCNCTAYTVFSRWLISIRTGLISLAVNRELLSMQLKSGPWGQRDQHARRHGARKGNRGEQGAQDARPLLQQGPRPRPSVAGLKRAVADGLDSYRKRCSRLHYHLQQGKDIGFRQFVSKYVANFCASSTKVLTFRLDKIKELYTTYQISEIIARNSGYI